jgi:hypothetical protein
MIAIALMPSACYTSGCGDNSKTKATDLVLPSSQQQAAGPTSQPAPAVDRMDANAGSADMLAHRAEAFSREMAPLIHQRRAAPPPVPSAVTFLDPSEFRLDSGPGRPSVDDSSQSADRALQNVLKIDPRSTELASPSGLALQDTPEPTSPRPAPPPAAPISTSALGDKLSRRVKEYPRDVSGHLEYQLLQFLLDEPAPQLAVLSALPSEDREMISAVIDGLTNFRNALRADNNMLLSKKIKPILEMSGRLRAQADLTIPAIVLCTKVSGFGNYDPIEPARFPAGVDNRAIIYCEIANFSSSLNDRQQWETRLKWDMTLYSDTGLRVWADRTESIVDTTRNRRHDFFVRKQITLPRTLPIGRYLLKATIIDPQANRVAEENVPLLIAAE